MKNNSFSIFIKFLSLTCVFFVVINYFWYLINADQENKQDSTKTNSEKFVSEEIEITWDVWVALTTNIWTRKKQLSETPVDLYKQSVELWEILLNTNQAKDNIINSNMLVLSEYLNILKTDIRSLLSSSNDREFALNSFISQLEYRYKKWVLYSNNLIKQKNELTNYYKSNESNLNKLKNDISTNFTSFQSKETVKSVDEYLVIKTKMDNAKIYIIFINKFLNYYTVLNNYNKKLLDTLINNKEILVKNSQVVIPDTWSEILKELKILYSEKDWKDWQ